MAFISTVLADFISLVVGSIQQKPVIPAFREHKYGYTCPAMQRLVFEEGGHLVRLSANICQLHRPNTIPIFCAAVCRDYRLRTYIGIALKFLLQHMCPQLFCALRGQVSRCHIKYGLASAHALFVHAADCSCVSHDHRTGELRVGIQL